MLHLLLAAQKEHHAASREEPDEGLLVLQIQNGRREAAIANGRSEQGALGE